MHSIVSFKRSAHTIWHALACPACAFIHTEEFGTIKKTYVDSYHVHKNQSILLSLILRSAWLSSSLITFIFTLGVIYSSRKTLFSNPKTIKLWTDTLHMSHDTTCKTENQLNAMMQKYQRSWMFNLIDNKTKRAISRFK